MNQIPMRTNQSQLSFRQARPSPDATLLVLGVWFVLSVVLILATEIFARPFPWLDDFAFLPFVTDKAPLRLEWLWQPHNEHRILLPKLFNAFVCRTEAQGRSLPGHQPVSHHSGSCGACCCRGVRPRCLPF